MKLKNKDGQIEHVKIYNCKDCGRWVVKIDGEELDSPELLANEYRIVQVELQEMNDFNEFMKATTTMLQTCWEYYLGRLDERADTEEEEEDDTDRPEKN